MKQLKCPACDGYGTRPHRMKIGKFTKCKACSGSGLILGFEPVPVVPTIPQVPWVPTVPVTPWPDPFYPFDPTRTIGAPFGPGQAIPDPYWITCGTSSLS